MEDKNTDSEVKKIEEEKVETDAGKPTPPESQQEQFNLETVKALVKKNPIPIGKKPLISLLFT